MSPELEFLNQKHLVHRRNRDSKFYRKSKSWVGPPVIFKHFDANNTCHNYHDFQYEHDDQLDKRLAKDKGIKKDPFDVSAYDVKYSLNKKKRWLIPEILEDGIEEFQKPEVNFKVASIQTQPTTSRGDCACDAYWRKERWRYEDSYDHEHDCWACMVKKKEAPDFEYMGHRDVVAYAGYSLRDDKVVIKNKKNRTNLKDYIGVINNPKNKKDKNYRKDIKFQPLNCEYRHKDHTKLKRWEHDITMVYVTEEQKFTKNQINSGKAHKHYECTCKPVKHDKNVKLHISHVFEEGDDEDVVPMDHSLFEEDTSVENCAPVTYILEDFIVAAKKTSRRIKKKKVSVDLFEDEQEANKENIPPVPKILPKKPRIKPMVTENKAQLVETRFEAMFKEVDVGLIENDVMEKWVERMTTFEEVIPKVAKIELDRWGKIYLYKKGVEYFEALKNSMLVARNVGDMERMRLYLQHVPSNEPTHDYSKSPLSVESIFPFILPKNTFLPSKTYSSNDAKAFSSKLSTIVPDNNNTIITYPKNMDFICNVCYIDDSDDRTGFALKSCMHYFCLDCWHQHVTSSISMGHVPIGCMEKDCSTLIDPKVLSYFFHQDLSDRYATMISDKRMMRKDFIPCKRCNHTMFMDNFDYQKSKNKLTICKCGQTYCVDCRQKVHLPLSCDERRMFANKTHESDDIIATMHISDAALCPGCGGLVDRTYGCNHMVCRCGYEFCYACGRPYNQHECEGQITRMPIMMLDVTNLNIPPSAFREVVIWRQKREHKNLWKLRKMYRKQANDKQAVMVVSQYSQICQLIEYAHIKQCLYFRQKQNRPDLKLVNKRFNELIDRLNFALTKLLNPSNDPDEISSRVFLLSSDLISLCRVSM